MDIMHIEDKNIGKQQLAILMEVDEDGISVPNWLIDVLKWITRMEIANSSLSFSCKLFNRICWPKLHGNAKSHNVPYLKFCSEPDEFGNFDGILKDRFGQIIPIGATPPPEYIRGFGLIIIRFLDTSVTEFCKNIALVEINLSLRKWRKNDAQLKLMSDLLRIFGTNINALQIYSDLNANCFLNFSRQFPTFIDQVPFLVVNHIVDLDLDTIFNWLMKPLTNGRQKILHYHIKFFQIWKPRELELRFINRIKEEFSNSTERTNFLTQLLCENVYDQFSLENEQTGEVLNLYSQISCMGHLKSYLARYPKGEEHWKIRSEERLCRTGKTYIQLDIDD